MLQAFLVVPAFGLAYLLGSHHTWLKRIGHLVLALVLLLVVSLSWCVAVDITPASQRPWVDSTQTNSELDLALGYNGLERLLGMTRQGGAPRQAATATQTGQAASTTGQSATSSAAQSSTAAQTGTSAAQSATGANSAPPSGSTTQASG